MKSFMLVASAACFMRASALLDAGALLDVDKDSAELKAGAGLGKAVDATADIKITLPKGVGLPVDHKPLGAPPVGHLNTWHPPHPGVIIDGCDEDGNDEWHYVHPCEDCTKTAPPHVWTTSTVSKPAGPKTTVVLCDGSDADGSSIGCPAGQTTGSATVPVTAAYTTPTILPVEIVGNPKGNNGGGSPSDPPVLDTTTVTVPVATDPAASTFDDPEDPTDPEDPDTKTTTPAAAVTTVPASASSVPTAVPTAIPSQGFSTSFTVPSGAQPSGPVYQIPSNSSAPTYSPPAGTKPSNGCAGEGCRPVYQPPSPAGGQGGAPVPSGTGAGPSSFPTIPAVAGASRQSISIFLFAGTAAAFACLL